MYEIFLRLLEEKGLKAADVCRGTGLPSSLFSEWKRGKSTPKVDKLQKIADFFGVTLDYLTTGKFEDNNEHYYTNDETREIAQEIFENPDLKSLFHAAKDLPPERLKAHIDFIKSLKQQEDKHTDEGC